MIFFLLSFISKAQVNLVPNPSFEDTLGCPTTLASLYKTTYWTSPTWGSPDYFNTCNTGNAGVPNNLFGKQFAFGGNAYIGISIYDLSITSSYREYIQVKLQQTLTSGNKYWVSFYVSLADSNDYAIKEIGAYFSDIEVNKSMDTTLSFIPQIQYNASVISDKINWTKISGSFIATGNENYLLIGNFNRKQTTTAIKVSNSNAAYSYYYMDNICVSNDSLICSQPVGITKIKAQPIVSIFPNPAVNSFTIDGNTTKELYDIKIYNPFGQVIYEEKNITSDSKRIDITLFNPGLLLVNIKTPTQNFYYKLLKIN